jgi:hypothetical protein
MPDGSLPGTEERAYTAFGIAQPVRQELGIPPLLETGTTISDLNISIISGQ